MLFWHFLEPGGSLGPELTGSYNLFLVTVSFLVASAAGYAALEIVDRMGAAATKRTRRAWLYLGAIAMGSGVWAMHFVGMLAFSLPVPVTYDLTTTIISILPAIFASLIALNFLERTKAQFIQLNVSGFFMAVGIGGMHYTGMEAMRMEGMMAYDIGLFVFSILVAHVLATFALYIKFLAAARFSFAKFAPKLVSAVALGMAVACMHYTAMAAAKFYPSDATAPPENILDPLFLSLAIAAITVFIMGLATVATIIDRRMEGLHASLLDTEHMFQLALDTANDAFIVIDKKNTIVNWNQAATRIFGWEASDAIGRTLSETIIPDTGMQMHEAGMARYLETGETNVLGLMRELLVKRRDGSEFPLEIMVKEVIVEGEPFFASFSRDISQRMQVERELKEAKESAEAGAKAKSEFLANMSHEIRTPMNGVIGMVSLLLDTELDSEQRRFAQTVSNSADALLTLLNDILDFSKIEAGKLELDYIDFDLRCLVEGVLESFGLRTTEKGVELVCLFEPDVPSLVNGDPGRIRQILTNLLGNAEKFTQQGEIIVAVKVTDRSDRNCKVLFEVKDTGIGIPPDRLEGLFESFTQADTSTTREYGGTGLGLTIGKQLAELMGGEIGARSSEGDGSTFWFTVPVEALPEKDQPSFVLDGEFQSKRILVVDDHPTNRLVLEKQLGSWGCRKIDEASDGVEALDMLRSAAAAGDPFEIALLDMMMPSMDGETLGRTIKSDPSLASTLLVMITSMGNRGDVARLHELGFAAYLTKPIKQSELFDCLVTLTSSADEPVTPKSAPMLTKFSLAENKRDRTRVLVAEDNVVNQLVAVKMLERLGCHPDVVGNGKEAVDALIDHAYDIVFMDIQMPEMDGFEATASIRKREAAAGKHTPIVAMTAHAMKGDRERCLKAGMDDYISKPFQPDDFAKAIERQLSEN